MEKMLKSEAINKLAKVMNMRDMSKKESNRGNAMMLRKKEKECKKLEAELSRVSSKISTYLQASLASMYNRPYE